MMVDIHLERGFAEVDHRFGDLRLCHFPLFDFLTPLPFQWMCLLYLVMWFGKFSLLPCRVLQVLQQSLALQVPLGSCWASFSD